MIQFKGNEDLAHGYLICRFDTCLLIDPAHSYDDIILALGGRSLSGIVLTHAHNDHIDLIGHFDAPIYIHQDDAHLLFEDHLNGYAPKTHPYKRKLLDLKLVSDGEHIKLADHHLEIIHTPGHTKGSICILYENKLFTGDTLFKESVGRHDLYSGNLFDLKRSILKILSLPSQTKIYPGHDEGTTVRNEQKNNPFYIKWLKQSSR
ncbi:MAG: MBL fold metallo-hydrolase [Acholeplasmataceae bacterium]|jgi:glyoxylase-like metal-dependent hydrolase (beta-lactamase superfamily II)|nr:MBL fold metallo-hydrolase [Acholeplasmataceae bacterium]